MNFYSQYSNGSKWIRVSGIGDSPENISQPTWSSSDNAKEDLKYLQSFPDGYSPITGAVEFSDFNNNLRIQICRFAYITQIGYKYESSFFGSDTLKIELNLDLLKSRLIHVKATPKHKAYTRRIEEAKPKEEVVSRSGMIPENVEKVSTLNDLGMSGGMHDQESFIVKFKDGSNAMYKTTDEGAIIGEVSTYDISKILNWNIVPETVSNNFGKGEGSCQKWVENSVEPYDGSRYMGYKRGRVEEKYFDDLSKIFVMDCITGNYDRHSGNVMIDENDKCWAIDNEAFGTPGSADDFIYSLDNRCGITDVSTHCPMIRWLDKNLDKEQYLKLREKVIENMKQVIDNKNNIINYYNKYKDDDFITDEGLSSIKIVENIKENLSYMQDYYTTEYYKEHTI